MKRVLFIALLVAAVICGIVIVCVPDLRVQLLGIGLAHRLKSGEVRNLAIDLTIARGHEISGADVKEEFPFQEDYKLGTCFVETLQSTSTNEEVAEVRVRSMASEQWAWTGGENLSDARFVVRVLPRGFLSGLETHSGKKSPLLDDSVMGPVFNLMWPALPPHSVQPGGKPWTASFTSRLDAPMVEGPVLLEHRLEFAVRDFETTPSGKKLVSLTCKGKVAARYEGASPVRVNSAGDIEGVTLIDPQTGLCTGGSYQITQGAGVLYQEPENVQYRWKQAMVLRFWNFQEVDPRDPGN